MKTTLRDDAVGQKHGQLGRQKQQCVVGLNKRELIAPKCRGAHALHILRHRLLDHSTRDGIVEPN